MNTFFLAIMMILSMSVAQSINPVKMVFMIMLMSMLLFLWMSLQTGTLWFPMIFFLLFMGGILIMFLILSSLLPNEKMWKMKIPLTMMLTLGCLTLYNSPIKFGQTTSGSSSLVAKEMLTTSGNLVFMSSLILLYFLVFVSMLSSEKSPLRMSLCYKGENFVNFPMKMAMQIIRKKDELIKIMNGSLWDLPSPSTMTYFWNFGSTLGICLATQILSGLFLTFHYTSYANHSFSSVVEIMREVWSGWVIRLIHMNGASVFFFFIYLHLFRGMFYFSAVHKKVWNSGVTIMIALMAISFLGYVLPWGQMSYWAVAVITNLFSVVPIVGPNLVAWIWGGFSVSAPTLTRFYSLHFLLPFILAFLVIVHLLFLHQKGSSNSLGLNSNMDKIQFHPYFTVKDLIFIIAVFIASFMITYFFPYILGDSVNNVPANAMQTPVHIQPEWYFLPSYAILRALPSKTAGVLALVASVTIFYTLTLYKLNFSTKFTAPRSVLFWSIVATFIFLMKMGSLPAEEPYVLLSKVGAMIYFSLILMFNI